MGEDMKFTVIIPTKNRQETAKQAIISCVNSNYKNIEVLISDVSSDDRLQKFIAELNDPRIKYFYHKKSLSMRDNWEYAVGKASGDYVSVIGDDDALMPDALHFAREVLKASNAPVLKCNSPIYKWPNYPFINRQNTLTLILPTNLRKVESPRDVLKDAYQFTKLLGTGPGIYHGIVSKKFIDELYEIRGRYFVDEVPDFDSGFATLLYSDSYFVTNFPIFVSGHSGDSNSGSMRFKSLNRKSLTGFSEDLNKDISDVLITDMPDLICNESVIVSAMLRFKREIDAVLSENDISFDKQGAFNYIADNMEGGYESTIFKYEKISLERLAQAWNVSGERIPNARKLAYGKRADQGINASAITSDQSINYIGVDCDTLKVSDILEAIPIIQSMTTDWNIMLNHIQVMNGFKGTPPTELAERKQAAIDMINEGNSIDGELALRNIIKENPLDANSAFLLGGHLLNVGNTAGAIPNLARALSLEFDLKTFQAYFKALVADGQLSFLRQVCYHYAEHLDKVANQLSDYYRGITEFEDDNFRDASKIFAQISVPFDKSIQILCEAYTDFEDGRIEVARAKTQKIDTKVVPQERIDKLLRKIHEAS